MTHLVLSAFPEGWRNAAHRGLATLRDAVVGDEHQHISGLQTFAQAILERPEGAITRLDVHSHGRQRMAIAPVGDDQPLQDGLLALLHKSGPLASRFAADAQVEFHGCNVAGRTRRAGLTDGFATLTSMEFDNDLVENGSAEYFVSELGRILLATHGGTVTAHTGYGLDGIGHPDGEEVTARIEAGGRSSFVKAVELDADRLRLGIYETLALVAGATSLRQAIGGPGTTHGEADAVRLLHEAEHWVGPSGVPTCREAFRAFINFIEGSADALRATSGAFGRMLH